MLRHREPGPQVALTTAEDRRVDGDHERREAGVPATIDALPEVADAVAGRIEVLLDGGIRRGADVFKALALGATAVGIGRPQAWGLAAFGQPGVERVIELYNTELQAIMRQAGTPTLADITPAHLLRA